MNKPYPRFSVLMSLYAKENSEWFKQSIDSVLSNTVLPSQIVIVKDGELSDELEAILKQYEHNSLFTIVGYENNKGLGFALNYGLSYCSHDYIARMDSDDICAPDRFEKQLEAFIKDDQLGLVGSNVYEFHDSTNNIKTIKKSPELNDDIALYCKKRNPFNHPSVMFLKEQVIRAGGYIDFYRHEDYYLWYRMIKCGVKTYNIQSCLVFMRTSDDFFKRRGGLRVLTNRIRLSKIMLNDHFINFGTHFLVVIINFASFIIPSFLRRRVYYLFLRKRAKSN